jgi:hypothetical protein
MTTDTTAAALLDAYHRCLLPASDWKKCRAKGAVKALLSRGPLTITPLAPLAGYRRWRVRNHDGREGVVGLSADGARLFLL